MKRKICTRLAAIFLAATLIVPASAAEHSRCRPRKCVCPSSCPQQTVPEVPTEPETPVIPEAPETPAEPEKPAVSGKISEQEQTACELINAERRANGLPALTIDEDLCIKARIKSQDMVTNKYFDHNSPTYGSPFTMMKNLGITYRSAGENIAMGYRTASDVVRAWMASEGHRNNILNANYTTMGIGYVNGFWTQWFLG